MTAPGDRVVQIPLPSGLRGHTITLRPDDDALRALSVLTNDGTPVSLAVRAALVDAARARAAAQLRAEAAALATVRSVAERFSGLKSVAAPADGLEVIHAERPSPALDSNARAKALRPEVRQSILLLGLCFAVCGFVVALDRLLLLLG